MAEDVLLDLADDGTATLTLNRPDRLNALSDKMVDEFFRALDRVAVSPARVLVLTGAGRGFCAGFDLTLAASIESPAGEPAAYGWAQRQERFGALVTRLRAIPQPVIAAVNGAATGAGLGLALACDVRLACRSARFSSAFVKVGMSSCDVGVSWLLPRAIGTSRAFELMLTGRMVNADEAERIGLVSGTTEDTDLMSRACALAAEIAGNGAMAVWMTKRGAWANLESGSLAAAIELENRTQVVMLGTGSLEARARERGFLKPGA
ncbi:MAG: enoyl-CoA hydratase-related protein [Gemmobacter sp.]|nr:enoyl-CoA hydratase-related protein [Gemmobacter sp.]